jgi:hypothetical protein
LCILLGCKFKVFLYFEIAFLQLIVVCFVIIARAFFLAVFLYLQVFLSIQWLVMDHLVGLGLLHVGDFVNW